MGRKDLRTLSIFVRVAERRSFVRAAADLGITQSGVSNAISRLEDQLGVRLLARTTRRVSLTDDGAAFFERCRQSLAELEEAELVLKETRLKPTGRLRVDMPVSFGRLKVVPLLGPFQAQYPDLKLVISFTDRYVDLVEEGIDVSVRFGVLQDSSLMARRLTQTQFRVVGAPGYLAKHGRPGTPDDLAGRNAGIHAARHRLARDWRFARDGRDRRSRHGQYEPATAPPLRRGLRRLRACTNSRLLYRQCGHRRKTGAWLEKFRPAIDPIWLVYPQTRHLSPRFAPSSTS
jgi:DNA-binding transcriptional LysR family regulator